MKDLLDRIESCNYECEAGPLSMNVDWVVLRDIITRYNLPKVIVHDPLDQPDAE